MVMHTEACVHLYHTDPCVAMHAGECATHSPMYSWLHACVGIIIS